MWSLSLGFCYRDLFMSTKSIGERGALQMTILRSVAQSVHDEMLWVMHWYLSKITDWHNSVKNADLLLHTKNLKLFAVESIGHVVENAPLLLKQIQCYLQNMFNSKHHFKSMWLIISNLLINQFVSIVLVINHWRNI